ncbi:rhomboid family intramembrane serine protease [Amphritea sp. HPY]|uniref:rhomboid family intramembrane serine protease n=1 Tax=Amphritea sp. HPY TaxID=3421652 RepID=UPI003D7E2EBA
MIEVLRVGLDEDLSGFTAILWQHKIPHRVLEQDGSQLLLVPRNVNAEQISHLFDLWQQGADLSGLQVSRAGAGNRLAIWRSKLSILLIVSSALITLLVSQGQNLELMRWFTIVDFQVRGEQIYYPSLMTTITDGQLWRLFTPAFMHFNLPHILFNLLWVWVVGRRIELLLGLPSLLLIFMFSALSSNLAQFWVSGPMFGGMSGVVFALLGFAWLWDRRNPQQKIGLPPALMGFMLFWLVLGFTGFLEGVGLGAIANTAHLIGLLSGLVLVFPLTIFRKNH